MSVMVRQNCRCVYCGLLSDMQQKKWIATVHLCYVCVVVVLVAF